MALRVKLTGVTPVHRQLVARREQLTDEVLAACHRVHNDIWLEKLEIRTQPPSSRQPSAPALASVDLAALLSSIDTGEDLKTRATALLSEIGVKIPGTIADEEQTLSEELPQLIAEARELLLTRASEPT